MINRMIFAYMEDAMLAERKNSNKSAAACIPPGRQEKLKNKLTFGPARTHI